MNNRRQERVAALLQETMGEILLRAGSDLHGGSALVSIVKTWVSPDLTEARFYVSVFNHDDPDALVGALEDRASEFRLALGEALRHHLRKIPEVQFFADDTIDQMERMDKLFRDLRSDGDGSDDAS